MNESQMITEETVALIVDDSPESLAMLNDALEQAGVTVLIALEGKQAINIAQKMQPDIIILDAIMPGMDGFEVCETLKQNPILANIPVIFMTGLSDTESIIKGLGCGGVDYLTKPIIPDELIARMRVHLSNAKLTNSANAALDSTGQLLFTVDQTASLQWATPQTYALLEKANTSEDDIEKTLTPQLARWLSHEPKSGQTIIIKDLPYPLEVRMVEYTKDSDILLKLLDGNAPKGAEKLKLSLPLTAREADVLYWIANGKTNREIGLILENSPRTINKHLEQIFRKLEVDNRTSAAAIAIRLLSSS